MEESHRAGIKRFPIPRNYQQGYLALQLSFKGWLGWLPFLSVGGSLIYFGIHLGFIIPMIISGVFVSFASWLLFRSIPEIGESPFQIIRRRVAAYRRKKIFKFQRQSSLEPKTQELLPFKGFKGDMLEMRDGGLRALFRVMSPINLDLLSESAQRRCFAGLQSAINGIQSDRFQIVVSSEAQNMTEYANYLQERMEKTHHSYHLERLDEEHKFIMDHAERTRFSKNFYFVLGTPTQKADDPVEYIRERSDELYEGIQGIYAGNNRMRVERCGQSEYAKMLHSKINPRKVLNQSLLLENQTFLEGVAPDMVIDRDRYIEMDGWYFRVIGFRSYPSQPEGVWLRPLLHVPGQIDLLIDIQSSAEKHKVVRDISNNMGEIQTELLRTDLPSYIRNIKEKELKDATMLLDQIQTDNETLKYVSCLVLIRESSLDGLENTTRKVESTLNRMKVGTIRLDYEGPDALFAALPILHRSENGIYTRLKNNMHAEAISGMYPFYNSDFQMSKGIRKGVNPLNESLVIVDRWDRSRFKNGNETVLGESGTGKTSYAEMDIIREHANGTKIRVVTPEPGFDFPFGVNMKISAAGKWCLNPFHVSSTIVDSDEEEELGARHAGEYLRIKIGHVMRWFRWIVPDLSDFERAKLQRYVTDVYSNLGYTFDSTNLPANFPTLSDLDMLMVEDPEMIRVRILLEPVRIGAYAKLFNGERNWSLETDLFVANVRDLSDDIRPAAMEILIQEFWEDAKKDDHRVGIYIDEMWYFADEKRPQTLEFIFELAKRIRKYTGYVVTLSQNVKDYLNGKSSAILNNSAFKKFFPMSDEDVASLGRFTRLTEREIEFLISKNYSQGSALDFYGDHRMRTETRYNMDELRILNPKRYQLVKHALIASNERR